MTGREKRGWMGVIVLVLLAPSACFITLLIYYVSTGYDPFNGDRFRWLALILLSTLLLKLGSKIVDMED